MISLVLAVVSLVSGADRYSTKKTDGAIPIIVLRDETAGVEASVAPSQGGELCGLRFRHNGQWRELLYRACDYTTKDGWRGKAPLLWPATGGTFPVISSGEGLRAGAYQAQGKEFGMPFHGFVQGMPWTLRSHRGGSDGALAVVRISDTAETRARYPFGFEIDVTYRLAGGRLSLEYEVRASKQNTGKMFYSIGNHITFQTPFVPGADPGKVRMETPAGALLTKDRNNFPTGETKPPPTAGIVELGSFVANPAVSLGGYKQDPTVLLTDPAGIAVRMTHSASKLPRQPFVQFNVWGDAKAGYISPEPWVGAQNSLNSKLGLVELDPGENWRWRIDIRPSVAK